MLSIDDLLKIILILAVAFAIAGISFQLMRMISKLVQVLEDVRHPISNASELTDYALEDYVDARSAIRNGLSDLKSAGKNFNGPIAFGSTFFKFISKIKGLLNRQEE